MTRLNPAILLSLLSVSWLSPAGNASDPCQAVTAENSAQFWRIGFVSNLTETVPYFTDGNRYCYIGSDISLSQLRNYRFHAFKENRETGIPSGNIYDILVGTDTTLESITFNSTYGAQFPSLKVYTPEGTLIGGAGTQSVNWWEHRYNADKNKPDEYPYPQISDDFPSGNAGQTKLQQTGTQYAAITLRNDGTEEWLYDFPAWRNWWFMKLSGVFTNSDFTMEVNDIYPASNRGWEYDYTPVYSYDLAQWFRFPLNDLQETTTEIDGTVTRKIRIETRFDKNQVWVARFYPYSTQDFEDFYSSLEMKLPEGYIKRQILGDSPALEKPVYLITVTNPNIDDSEKKRVWVHARTHSAEVGGSLLVEGLMQFLANSTTESQSALDNLIFHIVPIHNPDGVDAGNYRLNGKAQNLESMWYRDENNPKRLKPGAPVENRILNKAMRSLGDKDGDFTVALNLHSSQSERATRPFFFPHFGPESLGYTKEQVTLWNNTIRFINLVKGYYGPELIEPSPEEGGDSFVTANYPESWWWANYGSRVMAVTIETTYDQSGFTPDYVTPDDLRRLGQSVGRAILAYHKLISPPPVIYSSPTEERHVDPVTRDEVRSKE